MVGAAVPGAVGAGAERFAETFAARRIGLGCRWGGAIGERHAPRFAWLYAWPWLDDDGDRDTAAAEEAGPARSVPHRTATRLRPWVERTGEIRALQWEAIAKDIASVSRERTLEQHAMAARRHEYGSKYEREYEHEYEPDHGPLRDVAPVGTAHAVVPSVLSRVRRRASRDPRRAIDSPDGVAPPTPRQHTSMSMGGGEEHDGATAETGLSTPVRARPLRQEAPRPRPAGRDVVAPPTMRATPSLPVAPEMVANTRASATQVDAMLRATATLPPLARADERTSPGRRDGGVQARQPVATRAPAVFAVPHTAWADRWLARFAGMQQRAGDEPSHSAAVVASAATTRRAEVTSAAPDAALDRAASFAGTERASSSLAHDPHEARASRSEDDVATPDDVLTALTAPTTRTAPTTSTEPIALTAPTTSTKPTAPIVLIAPPVRREPDARGPVPVHTPRARTLSYARSEVAHVPMPFAAGLAASASAPALAHLGVGVGMGVGLRPSDPQTWRPGALAHRAQISAIASALVARDLAQGIATPELVRLGRALELPADDVPHASRLAPDAAGDIAPAPSSRRRGHGAALPATTMERDVPFAGLELLASPAPSTASVAAVELGRDRVGRHGGNEVEIPPWFATAARTVLADKPARSDLSIPELVLIAATPPAEVAASTREMPRAVVPPRPSSPTSTANATTVAAKQLAIDVEAIARDVYHHLLAQLEARRIRSGELRGG